jgi:tryptophanyl-tRNA synthetase
MEPKNYLVGVQPTGRLHIGNYLGCIQRAVEMGLEGHHYVTILVADYHCKTVGMTSEEISANTSIVTDDIYRCGWEGDVFYQSLQNTYVFWDLCCKANLGSLLRLPQYKSKQEGLEFDLGILLYPLLMAADIYVHNADVILIGEDQIPHIEFANDILPRIGYEKKVEYELSPYPKIMSLMDPTKKMSKSLGDKHVLYLNDDYSEKLKKANGTPEARINLENIAKGIGVDPTLYPMNSSLKEAMAEAMKEKFVLKSL